MRGREHKGPDARRYEALVHAMNKEHGSICLPAEYAHFVRDDLLRLLIRLARYKFVARLLRERDTVLDIGCGSGLGSIFLAQHCSRVVGVDRCEREVAEARSINRRANVEFMVADFFQLAPGRCYDVVVALDTIEHFSMQEGRRFLARMAECVDACGLAVIGTPSVYSSEYQGELSKAAHVKCYDQKELLGLVDEHFGRSVAFSMTDEVVHTGFPKLAWYYLVLAFAPKRAR